MWKHTVYSDGSANYVSNICPQIGEKVTITIRMVKDAPVEGVYLSYQLNGLEEVCQMAFSYERDGLCYYSCEISMQNRVLKYHFYLECQEEMYFYNQMGLQDSFSDVVYDFTLLSDYKAPSWIEGKVFYEIFPDRFCKGNPSLQVKDGEIERDGHVSQKIDDWNMPPKPYVEAWCLDYYGGDLEGIKEKIPYLKELGIDGVYLTPIFNAPSVHHYDCTDYKQVDEHLGGNEGLADLTKHLHRENMRIILDLSFNHTSNLHPWFTECKDYYYIDKDGGYPGYGNNKTMPLLNFESQELRNEIYGDDDSVLRHWLKPPYCIDGWRIDVGATVGIYGKSDSHKQIWPEIYRAIKDVNPDSYILSEDWNDSVEFLQGNQWDGIMNFVGCARPVREYIGQLDFRITRRIKSKTVKSNSCAKALKKRILQTYGKIPFALWGNQFNMIDCHDIGRLHNDKNISWDRYVMALYYQYMLPGAVCLYYGDEIGIEGGLTSPEECRYPMNWNVDLKSNPYYNIYSRLNKAKRENEAMQHGGFSFLYTEGKCAVIARFTNDNAVLLISSMDKEDTTIKFSLKGLGNKASMPNNSLLGEELHFSEEGQLVTMKIPAEYGYLVQVI